MDCMKEGQLWKYKAGTIKSTEKKIYGKVICGTGSGEKPCLHINKDKDNGPTDVLIVKRAVAVKEHDSVPKLVKANHENYICIESEHGVITFLRASSRQERDEWCTYLERPLRAFRPRVDSESSANRPPPRRDRPAGEVVTAPGTALGIFKKGLPLHRSKNPHDKCSGSQFVTYKAAAQDGTVSVRNSNWDHKEDVPAPTHYENVSRARPRPGRLNMSQEELQRSRTALKESARAYTYLGKISRLQEVEGAYGDAIVGSSPSFTDGSEDGGTPDLERPTEEEKEAFKYDYPVERQAPALANRLSDSSTSSSENGAAESRPHFTAHGRTPCESSWPPSPEHSWDSQNERTTLQNWPRDDHDTMNNGLMAKIPEPEPEANIWPASQQERVMNNIGEVDSKGKSTHPPKVSPKPHIPKPRNTRKSETKNSPVSEPEPEATLCQLSADSKVTEENEYMNVTFSGKPAPIPPKPSNRTPTYPNTNVTVPEPEASLCLPPAREGLAPPPQPAPRPIGVQPINVQDYFDKLLREKMEHNTIVKIWKDVLTKNNDYRKLRLHGSQQHKTIMVTNVPPGLRRIFHVGDELCKINDQLLVGGATYAERCIETTDRSKVKVTVHRLPFGTLCKFRLESRSLRDIGLTLDGRKITEVDRDGLAVREGHLMSKDTTSLFQAGIKCNYIITEINYIPVDYKATTKKVQDLLRWAGRDIVLILHPEDFTDLQRDAAEYDI